MVKTELGHIYYVSTWRYLLYLHGFKKRVSASSFLNSNDWNITSKELLANTFVKTNPANKYSLKVKKQTLAVKSFQN